MISDNCIDYDKNRELSGLVKKLGIGRVRLEDVPLQSIQYCVLR
jgi:hypothetical protein